MSVNQNVRPVTVRVGAAIEANKCIVITAGIAALAGAAADPYGVTLGAVSAQEFTDGEEVVQVAPISEGGLVEVEASAAIAAGANVGCAAAGEVRTAVTGDTIIGTADSVAAGADEIITLRIDRKITVSA